MAKRDLTTRYARGTEDTEVQSEKKDENLFFAADARR